MISWLASNVACNSVSVWTDEGVCNIFNCVDLHYILGILLGGEGVCVVFCFFLTYKYFTFNKVKLVKTKTDSSTEVQRPFIQN